jgi:hypothetical protein
MSLSTPVAFLIFNRPDLTEIVFKAIAQAKPKKLFVVADGPRFPEEADKCQRARAVVNKIDWDCDIFTNFSETNLGCKLRVFSGIDWVFSQVDEAIFLEDDCLPDASFFSFCQTLLARYRDDSRIMHIGGGNFLFNQVRIEASYYFSRYAFAGYGWASWKRAWNHYDPNMKSWPEFKENGLVGAIFEDEFERDFWAQMLDKTFIGDIDTWDFQWFYTCWCQGGLSILPSVNLVSNLGFRPDATHTKAHDENPPLANLKTSSLETILHPRFLVRNKAADTCVFNLISRRGERTENNKFIDVARTYLSTVRQRATRLLQFKSSI